MLLMMLVQAVSGPVDPAAVRRGCRPAAAPDEVVVCARSGESPYRLQRLPDQSGKSAIPAAATTIAGVGSVALEAQAGNVGPIPTNRAMVTLRVPF